MTIRKQFFLLSTLIITIPLLCILYSLIHLYLNSSQRLVINGFKEIERSNNSALPHEVSRDIESKLRSLPQNVDTVIIQEKLSDDNINIIFSSINDFENDSEIKVFDFWSFIRNTSDKYFYQFSTAGNYEQEYMILTRIPKYKEHSDQKGRPPLLYSLITFLFVIVFALLIIIIYISRSIFSSISILEKSMKEIAEGNLDEKPDCNNERSIKNSNEIISISNNLEKMRCSLIEAQNRKNKLIMGISHDLRTPVAVIKGYTEAILDNVVTTPEDIKKSLELIQTKTTQLEGMIDSLINYTKLNTSELREKMVCSSITKMIKNFANDVNTTASVFKRNLVTNIKLDEDICIPIDEQLVHRAFENIYSNALRYTTDGDTIELYAERIEDSIIFKISDTGIGIEKKDLDNIFELFYRGTNSRREEGMGIGLSVVKNIIDTHGWTIHVESEKGKGSSFIITIPVKTC